MKLLLVLLIIAGLIVPGIGYGETEPVSRIPSLIDSLKIQEPLDFCGEKVPLEEQEIRERLEKELLLSLWDRAQILLWLKRSRRYLTKVEQMLNAEGLPQDLKYVAVAESSLLEHIYSSKGAVGMWQFMAETGKKYGLIIDSNLDERRDFFAATRAAIRYFRDLHTHFSSWTLSAAAYNMGEDKLSTEIQEQGTDRYYELFLPPETQRFLFRILSAKLILSNPKVYGFELSDADFYPPVLFDEVQVTLNQEVPLRIIADAAGTYFKRIRDLNPALRTRYLPEGTHSLRIPRGTSEGFQARLEAALKTHLSPKDRGIYVIRNGDSLSSISARFQIPLASILLWNRLDPREPIHPGQRLLIYSKPIQKAPAEKGAETESDP
ncbi:MAG: lytic transglycosylase [Desulfobacterales bacterium CG07_land_8_20_14_0_80_52_14]|nr:MAG: lytic transglycosylase [Desulfobacterales bacterium CG23_combo_of_CG06-09_8_20_14_all_52_9]PIU50434.1 MAG: lytic transglycosylase [Desulfobacterales bacterium CG07_land_8_20_14_0_80_52_14]